jgi:hypothetical protein
MEVLIGDLYFVRDGWHLPLFHVAVCGFKGASFRSGFGQSLALLALSRSLRTRRTTAW